MANTQVEIIRNAKKMIVDKWVYVYGYKNGKVTKDRVEQLAKMYPSVFVTSIKKLSLGKVGKMATDCSGFVCNAAGIPHIGSSQIYSSAPSKWGVSNLKHVNNAMFIWRSGHVALIEIDDKGNKWILEAQSTATDLKRTRFETRYKKFTHYGEIKGVVYSKDDTSPTLPKKKVNPYKKPTSTIRFGAKGESVKWIQWELVECGYKLKIDGIFGGNTLIFAKKFQQSSKLTVDGIVGTKTINALVNI
jgi:hypothetical protein